MKICLKNALLSDGNRWEERGDILVEDGRIAAVGLGLSGERNVDLAGHTILPGLIDAHVHVVTGPIQFNDVALKSWAQAGVLTLRDMGLGNGRDAEDYLAWRKTVDRPDCAEILTAGQCIAAHHGYMHLMGPGEENGIGVKTPEEAVSAINRQLDMGCDGVKTAMDLNQFDENTPQHSPETLRAIAKAARARGVWCAAHVLESRFLETLVDNDIPEMAHMVLDPIPEELLNRMVQRGVAVTCTLQSIHAPRPPLPPEALAHMPPEMRAVMERMSQIDTAQQERDAVENTRRFHEKGGLVVMGTDTMRMEAQPQVACVPLREFQLLHQAGLSLQECIAAATCNAAKVCKVEDRLGSIQVGKQANLIAIPGRLEEDFSALAEVQFVMKSGVILKGA